MISRVGSAPSLVLRWRWAHSSGAGPAPESAGRGCGFPSVGPYLQAVRSNGVLLGGCPLLPRTLCRARVRLRWGWWERWWENRFPGGKTGGKTVGKIAGKFCTAAGKLRENVARQKLAKTT